MESAYKRTTRWPCIRRRPRRSAERGVPLERAVVDGRASHQFPFRVKRQPHGNVGRVRGSNLGDLADRSWKRCDGFLGQAGGVVHQQHYERLGRSRLPNSERPGWRPDRRRASTSQGTIEDVIEKVRNSGMRPKRPSIVSQLAAGIPARSPYSRASSRGSDPSACPGTSSTTGRSLNR